MFHDSIDLMHYTSALALVNMLLNKSHEWVHEIGNSKIEKYEKDLIRDNIIERISYTKIIYAPKPKFIYVSKPL